MSNPAPKQPSTAAPRGLLARWFGRGDAGTSVPVNRGDSDDAALASLRTYPRLARHDEIPVYEETLTQAGNTLQVREQDRRVIAVLRQGDHDAIVLFRNHPGDAEVLDLIRQRARARGVDLGTVYEADESLIAACYGRKASVAKDLLVGEQSRTVDMFDDLLKRALIRNASDIHFQCYREKSAVYLRVNGKLLYTMALSRDDMIALANTMYTLADDDSRAGQTAFHKESFQDCSITREVRITNGDGSTVKHEVKLRWGSAPAYPDSFDIVLRVLRLGSEGRVKSLEQLGYSVPQQAALTYALTAPLGAIILVGATGSGKSTTNTTLSTLWSRRNPGKLLRTIEEPAEYIIPGARQVSISRAMDRAETKQDGSMLAKALKAAMRMDPDALLIGEIRDNETADLATKAISTGHKVFTTLHANSPFAAVDRLVRMGIGRHEITERSFLNAVVFQTLLPVLCPHCRLNIKGALEADMKRPAEDRWFTRDFMDEFKAQFAGEITQLHFQGPGCQHCAGGIVDRTVAAEILLPDRQLQGMILADKMQLAYAYWRGGLCESFPEVQGKTIMDQAIEKMRAGLVSPLDIYRALGAFSTNTDPEQERLWYHEQTKLGTNH